MVSASTAGKRRARFGTAFLTCVLSLLFIGCDTAGKNVAAATEQTADSPKAAFSTGAARDVRELTLMIYIIGADLEAKNNSASSDIVEMIRSDFDTEHNNLILMTGGTTKWNRTTGIPSDALTVSTVTSQGLTEVMRSEAASMGDPDTLSGFLRLCCENFPANRYGLIFWDHGGGPMVGYGMDTQFSGDSLLLPELRQALADSPFSQENKLDFVGFDACLMSSVEVAHVLSDYADYMIASEEVIPGDGWDYGFLSDIDVNAPGSEIGIRIIDDYMDYYAAHADRIGPDKLSILTLSCLDLSRVAQVESTLDALFGKMDVALVQGKYSDIARARGGAKGFAKEDPDPETQLDLVDLTDLASLFENDYPEEVGALKAALSEMIVYNRANTARANGVTIYYPLENKKGYETRWGRDYAALHFAPAYTSFMRNFGAMLLGESLAEWKGAMAPMFLQDDKTQEFYLQLSPEQVANYGKGAYFLVRHLYGDLYALCCVCNNVTLDGQGRLTADFNGDMLYVTDRRIDRKISVTYYDNSEEGGAKRYQIPAAMANVDENNGRSLENAYIRAYMPEGVETAELTSVVRKQQDDWAMAIGKEDKRITDWSEVTFFNFRYVLTRDADGTLLPVPMWELFYSDNYEVYDTSDGFTASFLPLADDGSAYYMQIAMRDTQSNLHVSELIPIGLTAVGEKRRSELYSGVFAHPEARSVKEVSFPAGSKTPVELLQEWDVTVTLTDVGTIEFPENEYGNKHAPAPGLTVRVKNEGEESVSINCLYAWVNDISAQVSSCDDLASGTHRITVPANAETTGYIVLGTDEFSSPGLFTEKVEKLERLDLRFMIDSQDASTDTRILTDLPLTEYGFTAGECTGIGQRLPAQEQRLLSDDGIDVTLVAAYENSVSLNMLLRYEVTFDYFDRIEPDSICCGNTKIQSFSTPSAIGEGRRAYDWVSLSYSDLRVANLSAPKDIKLRFTRSQRKDTTGSQLVNLTKKVSVPALDSTYCGMAYSEKGVTVLEQEGVRITLMTELPPEAYADRLMPGERPWAPAACKLMIENNGTGSIGIDSRGAQINGEDAAFFLLINEHRIEPGMRAFEQITISEYNFEKQGIQSLDTVSFALTVSREDGRGYIAQNVPVTIRFADEDGDGFYMPVGAEK